MDTVVDSGEPIVSDAAVLLTPMTGWATIGIVIRGA